MTKKQAEKCRALKVRAFAVAISDAIGEAATAVNGDTLAKLSATLTKLPRKYFLDALKAPSKHYTGNHRQSAVFWEAVAAPPAVLRVVLDQLQLHDIRLLEQHFRWDPLVKDALLQYGVSTACALVDAGAAWTIGFRIAAFEAARKAHKEEAAFWAFQQCAELAQVRNLLDRGMMTFLSAGMLRRMFEAHPTQLGFLHSNPHWVMFAASSHCTKEHVRVLLDFKASVQRTTCFQSAITDCVEEDTMLMLIDAKADIHPVADRTRNNSPLRFAVERGWTHAAEVMLALGAKPVQTWPNGLYRQYGYQVRLHRNMLCFARTSDCVQLLLSAKAPAHIDPKVARGDDPLFALVTRACDETSTPAAVKAMVDACKRDPFLNPWRTGMFLVMMQRNREHKPAMRDVWRDYIGPMIHQPPTNVPQCITIVREQLWWKVNCVLRTRLLSILESA